MPTVHPEPNQVNELDVPIFCSEEFKNVDELDLTTQQVRVWRGSSLSKQLRESISFGSLSG